MANTPVKAADANGDKTVRFDAVMMKIGDCREEEEVSAMDRVRIPPERTAAQLEWTIAGEVLVPGVFAQGGIE